MVKVTDSTLHINIKVNVMLSLWSAIKIRIAGFSKVNVNNLGKLNHVELRK